MTDFPQLIKVLVSSGVEFIIVGGAAAIVHGAARLTEDLDVVYRRNDQNTARLIVALESHSPYLRGAPPGLPFRWEPSTIRNGLNFTLITDIGAIDLLGEITGGGGYEDLLPDSISLKVFGFDCWCLDLEKLIFVKRAAGRPKDLEAVAELESILDER
ncbi:MAG: hypothetical protein ABIP75_03435 [Pyrinomonadaceae bacterium]